MENINSNLIQEFQNVYFPPEIITNLVLSFILGVVLNVTYKKTHKGQVVHSIHDYQYFYLCDCCNDW